jgi:hypothetical protein
MSNFNKDLFYSFLITTVSSSSLCAMDTPSSNPWHNERAKMLMEKPKSKQEISQKNSSFHQER